MNSSDISALYQDKDGYIWIGNKPGVSRFDGYTFKNFTVAGDQFLGTIYCISEDKEGGLWIGGANGLFYLQDGTFRPATIPVKNIRALEPGLKGEMWVGGLGFVPFALSPQDLLQLRQSREVRISPIVTDEEWELAVGSFRLWAMDVAPNGELWLGLDNALTSYDGKQLHVHWRDRSVIHKYEAIAAFGRDSVFWGSQETPAIFLKNGQISEAPEATDAPYTYLISVQPEEKALLPKELVLPHDKNFLEFRFSATGHTKTSKNRYQYRLEGLDQDWSKPTANREMVYSGLRPGYYTFKVRAANNDGLWGNTVSYSFRILPPIWWRWWSIMIYVILVAAVVYGIYRFQLSKNIALLENSRLKELDQVKSTLYTNITHEFGTPLTVFLGMTQQLRQDVKKVALTKLDAIQRSGRHLVELINQMLALSKLESGQMQLEPVQADIVAYLRYLYTSFDSYAKARFH